MIDRMFDEFASWSGEGKVAFFVFALILLSGIGYGIGWAAGMLFYGPERMAAYHRIAREPVDDEEDENEDT